MEDCIAQVRDFVNGPLNNLLHAAKPHMTCKFCLGKEVSTDLVRERHWNQPFPNEWYVLVECNNGDYHYLINVSGDSFMAITYDVSDAILDK